MNNQKQITALIKAVSGQANILTIPRIYIDLLDGDIVAALFLSQCVYWSDRTKNPEGWFYKTAADWAEETGLSRYQLDRSVKKTADFVEKTVKRAEGSPTAHYRVDMDSLTESICEFLEVGFVRNSQIEMRETDKTDLLETDKLDLLETRKSLTETTRDYLTKITAEITTGKTVEEERHPKSPIFSLYEQNIGPITPMISEQLIEAENDFPYEWIEEAVRIAVSNNARRWAYVRAILDRWQVDGPMTDNRKNGNGQRMTAASRQQANIELLDQIIQEEESWQKKMKSPRS